MVDEKRRRFFKHLGLVGAAGVIGLGISQFSGKAGENLVDSLEGVEQERGYRKVWATKRDRDNNYGRTYEEYFKDAERLGIWECSMCHYIYDVTEGREARFDELPSDWVCADCGSATKDEFEEIGIAFISGGQPFINEVACAYHFDEDGDGKYQSSEEGVFCTMPCRTICPVDAIKLDAFGNLPPEQVSIELPKRGPNVEFDTCIGCGRCHKICGYNTIEWVNVPYKGKNARRRRGGGE